MISAPGALVAALMLAALKLLLCSFQLMYASPDLSPIDDTLMVDLAKSIASGQWLGEYNWLTLGKHSFFALWLALLNKLGLNFLIGGQLLFAAAALLLLGALRPLFKTNLARFFVFGIVLWTPASWAEHSPARLSGQYLPRPGAAGLCRSAGGFCALARGGGPGVALLYRRRPGAGGGVAVARGQCAAAALSPLRGDPLRRVSRIRPRGAIAGKAGAVGGAAGAVGRLRGRLVRHEPKGLRPLYRQRFHLQ